jgi:DNA polymerase I-like protein with 3'-5' exonuclease and polymerase domains
MIDLFPDYLDTIAVDEAFPFNPRESSVDRKWTASGRSKVMQTKGDGCNLCKRCDLRKDPVIAKPRLVRGTTQERMLVVLSQSTLDVPTERIVTSTIRGRGYEGHILYDFAFRCGTLSPRGGAPVKDSDIAACRPYLSHAWDTFKPEMVVLMGSQAAKSFAGFSIATYSNRRSYFNVYSTNLKRRIPVIGTHRASDVLMNEMFHRHFVSEVELLLDLHRNPSKNDLPKAHAVLVRPYELDWADDWLSDAKVISFDTETYGLQHQKDFQIVEVTMTKSLKAEDLTLVFDEESLTDATVRAWLRKALTQPHIQYGGQNIDYDITAFDVDPRFGFRPGPIAWDTRVNAKLIHGECDASLAQLAFAVGIPSPKREMDEAQKDMDQEEVVQEAARGLVDEENPEITADRAKYLKKRKKAYMYRGIDPDVLHRYAARDSWVTLAVHEHQQRELDQYQPVREHGKRLIYPAYGFLGRMSRVGLYISRDSIKQAGHYFGSRIAELDTVLKNSGVSPSSNASVGDYIQAVAAPEMIRRTETGAISTDQKALELLKGDPLIDNLLAWRKLVKLYGSYVTTLPNYIGKDGRVHPRADIVGARSGRLSMTEPAAQTIPSKGGPDAKVVKNLFQADGRTFGNDWHDDDWIIIQADYKTLEIYIAAAWSMDKEMLSILLSGADFHAMTAAKIAPDAWGISSEECLRIIREQKAAGKESPYRNQAKTANFAAIYKSSAKGLSSTLGIALPAAEKLVEGFEKAFSGLVRVMEDARIKTQLTGEVWIPWDGKPARRRELPSIGYHDYRRGGAERGSQNSPIQGWASDICLSACVKIEQELLDKKLPARIILSVHDSILVECKSKYRDEVRDLMQRCMTEQKVGPLTLKADFEYGFTWGNLQPF